MSEPTTDMLKLKFLGTLTESQARWYVAGEAIASGRGGVTNMHRLTGMSRPTILRGIRELRGREELADGGRTRKPGGGRKRLELSDPGLTAALEKIMDENTAGDPMSLLRWTNKTAERIAHELTGMGHPVGADSVRRRLRELDYSLQINTRSFEGVSPPERDARFRYINRLVKERIAAGEPVLSIDTKKKEQVGLFLNKGRTFRRKGDPLKVNAYDFPSLGRGPAIPYGAFDPDRNEGFVNVGMSHDTAEFAVETLRQWWRSVGRHHYPEAQSLLLCADGGGSNGTRNRGWKYHLQRFADETGLRVTVCHYPPGTSKWNKIEHRMFSYISMNWRGKPLTSYETVINLIGSTRTKTGLRVKARLDPRNYETGLKITDEQMAAINITSHKIYPKWNYTISASRSHDHL